jgi:hypothetical protein
MKFHVLKNSKQTKQNNWIVQSLGALHSPTRVIALHVRGAVELSGDER